MKKFIKALALALTAVVCFAVAGCGAKKDEVKVLETICLTEESYAFAINKNDTALKDSIDGIINEMKADGSLDTLIESYFNGESTFTYENKTTNAQSGDFVMATNAYFPPFEYYEGDKFAGIDVEIASIIATKLGKTLYVKDMEFDSIIPEVMNGSGVVGMAGMTVTEKRLSQVNFAVSYYTSAQVITVQKGDKTFDGCTTAEDVEAILASKKSSYKVGTQKGTTGYMYSAGDEDFGYDGFKNLTTKSYDTGALAITDLSNGKINAVILDLQPSLMISKSINANFKK